MQQSKENLLQIHYLKPTLAIRFEYIKFKGFNYFLVGERERELKKVQHVTVVYPLSHVQMVLIELARLKILPKIGHRIALARWVPPITLLNSSQCIAGWLILWLLACIVVNACKCSYKDDLVQKLFDRVTSDYSRFDYRIWRVLALKGQGSSARSICAP